MQISDTTIRKFIEVNETSEWEILSDTGFVDIASSNKTVEYRRYKIVTETGKFLECADTHIIFTGNHEEIFAQDCLGHHIHTVDGLELVTEVIDTGIDENMYDLSIDSPNHRYYSNGILSHNSTIVAAYIAWLVLFKSSQRACVLANNLTTAKEIFGRVQFIIENCPKWLQQGIKEWNKTSFILENKSSAFCAATSPSSIRGQSLNCIDGDETVTIRDSETGEEFTLTIESLYAILEEMDTTTFDFEGEHE